ncbi:TSUP family transporter [Bacillus sp. FSL R12-0069]|uniref:TSUP family transporter n=1 Tax=Bacillus sp. FSL R12-0069 TaxID=2975342 RepID=UPI004046D392
MWRIKTSSHTLFELEYICIWPHISLLVAIPLVGGASGIIGAGGSFLLVPIMLVILKLPIRTTIATSIAITFISSVGITTGKVITGQVVVIPALIIAIASIFAAPLGARVGKRINQKALQYMLSILIVGTAVKMWIDMLSK